MGHCEFCGGILDRKQKRFCTHSCAFKNTKSKLERWDPEITPEMHEAIEGMMFSDGHIGYSKTSINPIFELGQSEEHAEYVDFVSKDVFHDNGVSLSWKRSRKKGQENEWWHHKHVKTRSTPKFVDYHKKWYYWGYNKSRKREMFIKKISPSFKITPLSLWHTFIGDGTIWHEDRMNFVKYFRIKIYTNSFIRDEIGDIFIPQLKNIGLNPSLNQMTQNGNIEYCVAINGNDEVRRFLEYIGPCPIECYKYKFLTV